MRKSATKYIESEQKNITSSQQIPLTTLQKMELSQALTNILTRLSYIWPEIQSVLITNIKTITPIMYWFLIDAYYYSWDIGIEYKTILKYRLPNQSLNIHKSNKHHEKLSVDHEQSKQSVEDKLQFIDELKTWIAEYKGTINLQDIEETSIDEIIEIASGNLEVISYSLDEQFNLILQKVQQEQKNQEQFLNSKGIKKRQVHPIFMFDEAEDEICEVWFQKFQKVHDVPKCYICSQRDNLIQCQTCSLKIHQKCYPTLMKKNSKNKKNNNLQKQEITQFQCENCRLSIDSNSQICELCCCSGGYFVQAETNNQYNQEVTLLDNSQVSLLGNKVSSHLEFNVVRKSNSPKYLHLTCFIWNADCEWDAVANKAQFYNKIDRKILNAICSFCGISFGSSIPCNNDTCRRSYHPECAKNCHLEMNLIRAKTSVIQIFCERHRHLRNYEAVQQAHENRFRECRKLLESIDKELKRNTLVPDQPWIKLYWEKDSCTACSESEIKSAIEICCKCRKWYHLKCSSHCKNCY